ncbi:hypothetical protein ACEPAI_3513 [Sanghuangporus weigelae]
MATNEHFLLVNLANVVNTLNRVIFTVDEVIQDVKKARINAKLNCGSRTVPFVTKALRKLDHNDHIRLLDVDGKAGFRFTPRGTTQIKRAMQDCPQRKRCSPRSAKSLRARDVLRIGTFLKKRLIRDSDDILDEMRENYVVSIRGKGTTTEETASEQNDVAVRVNSNQQAHNSLNTLPSSSSRLDLCHPSPSLLFAEPQEANFLRFYPSFQDIASESETDRPHFSTSESEQERRSMEILDGRDGSRSPTSIVDFPCSPFGICCASPQSFADTNTPRCGVKEEEDASFFIGLFQKQGKHHAPDGALRKYSFESYKTLVDSSAPCDYLPCASSARRKRVKKSRDDKGQIRSSSSESHLGSSPESFALSELMYQRRSTRQETLLRRRKKGAVTGRHRPYEDIGAAPCPKLQKHSKRLLLPRRQ